MYIGKLNDKIQEISLRCLKKNLQKAPVMAQEGNPFRGETLEIRWEELTANGVDLYVSLSDSFYLNNVVVYLAEQSAPYGISLYTAGKEKLISSHRAETGCKMAEKEIALSVEDSISEFVLEFDSDFSDVCIEKIELYGASFEGEKIFPTPMNYTKTEGAIKTSALVSVFAENEDAKCAAKILSEKYFEKTGIVLEEAAEASVQFLFDGNLKKNAYNLTVSEQGVQITASDRKGFVQGAETLIKIVDGDEIPCCQVKDEPFCEFRGVHMYLPSVEQMPFVKRVIKYVLSPMGYNFMIMEIAGTMQFDSHPEINECFLDAIAKAKAGLWPPFPHGSVADGTVVSKKDVREYVEYVRSFGIEVVPEIQSLGHVQFMTLAHPDIAEKDENAEEVVLDARLADIPPKAFYAHSFCSSNPKSYEILFDLVDEIIEVVQPKEYVHMGHDEVYQIGVCPVCKHKDPSDLFADDINKLYNYLKAKGYKMMIWSDMLQPVTKYKTFGAIDRIPKDILMLDFIWYFHLDKDIEQNLLDQGFEVLVGNLYSSHYPRYEKRIRSKGMRGGQISAWVGNNEYSLGKEGKFYDFMLTAQMLWSESYTRFCRYSYDKVISGMIPQMRQVIQQKSYPSLAAAKQETAIKDAQTLELVAAPSGSEYPVNAAFDSIVFEHASSAFLRRIPWVALEKIGQYTIRYEDGTEEVIALEYGGNLSYWNRRQNEPFAAPYYRHNGYSGTWFSDGRRCVASTGEAATLYCYEWINPKPEVKIASILFTGEEGVDTGVIIHKISGITTK